MKRIASQVTALALAWLGLELAGCHANVGAQIGPDLRPRGQISFPVGGGTR